ncbi:MAG TPA: M36 family metallopeptidase [Thermoanaerobaculia bacterium]|nr:M36 family metallopeptidase [Thermoanaerobaculia bacterium]
MVVLCVRRSWIPALLLFLCTAPLLAGHPADRSALLRRHGAERIELRRDGRISDAWNLDVPLGTDPVSAIRGLIGGLDPGLVESARVETRLATTIDSLTGTHVVFQQWIDGLEVVGGVFGARFNAGGSLRALHNRLVPPPPAASSAAIGEDPRTFFSALPPEARELVLIAADPVYLRQDDRAIHCVRLIVRRTPLEDEAWYVAVGDRRVVMREPLYYLVEASVFLSNPVTYLNDPSLRDHDDAAAAVPQAAYATVTLEGLSASGTLSGPNVQIVDTDLPATARAELSKGLIFDRASDEFEEVMAYYHLDRSQRYLQSLGYTGTRRIVNRSIRVDAHAVDGADNSYYVVRQGEGSLFFGDGGVDDAEDPDILLHEYGHAIHDSIAPGAFSGTSRSEARAMSEGFSDYWAFSEGYDASITSGRDPFCIGDWDARCGGAPTSNCSYPAGADCLRRTDSRKTIDDFIDRDQPGTEHRNGEIWSSALREIFAGIVAREGIVEGKATADRIVLEAMFGAPTWPRFATIARNMLEVDSALTSGRYQTTICGAMQARGILSMTDCAVIPRGEFVLHPGQGAGALIPETPAPPMLSSLTISDPRTISRLLVRVDLQHPRAGDLSIILISPHDDHLLLQPAGVLQQQDLRVTFGLDAVPAQSLSILHGRSALGEWKLEITDGIAGQTGRLLGWSLLLQFEGDQPAFERPWPAEGAVMIPAVAHVRGAEQTEFVSDVRLLNRSSLPLETMAILTPSGTDGRDQFRAIRLRLEAGQSLELADTVLRDFLLEGVGNLEFRGDLEDLLITSRNYNNAPGATYGQHIPPALPGQSAAAGDGILLIPQIRNTNHFRSNIGFAEIAGGSGTIRFAIHDPYGNLIDTSTIPVLPFSHLQIPVLGGIGGRQAAAASVRVTVSEGDARIVAYGSTVDNGSGDPVFIPARRSEIEQTVQRLAVVGRLPGLHGTAWVTDLWLTNPGDSPETVELALLRAGLAPVQVERMIPARGSLLMEDLLLAAFGLDEGSGQLEVRGPVFTTSRIWTAGKSGTMGQFIPPAESFGVGDSPVAAIGAEWSTAYRTNVGIAEAGGEAAVVRLQVHDAAGMLLDSRDFPLAPDQLLQFGLDAIGISSIINGRVSAQVIGGSGRVSGYLSIVDNGSGDPTFVPMR